MNFVWGKRQFYIILFSILLSMGGTACSGAGSPATVGATLIENHTDDEKAVGLTGGSSKDGKSSGDSGKDSTNQATVSEAGTSGDSASVSDDSKQQVTYRDNTPVVLEPSSPGVDICGNELVTIDTSNDSEGYITVHYKGINAKVKFQLTGPDGVTYTYDLDKGVDVLPLTAGSGAYQVGCFENVSGTEYAIAYTDVINLTIDNEFGAYLYPNLYVNFDKDTKAVDMAQELVAEATCDLDVVYAIYKYTIDNIVYDHELAETVGSGYVPVVDDVLEKKSGICFDYAVLMAAMLRSQGIPARLEIGYAGTAYHAWISTYIEDIGWIDGIIEFDGNSWTLMDPTFAANSDKTSFEEFIGDGSNYNTIYVY